MRVGWGAPRRGGGGGGIVGHGNLWVVLVPRVGIGQKRGRGVAVTRVGPPVPVGTATPYWQVVVAVPGAAPGEAGIS